MCKENIFRDSGSYSINTGNIYINEMTNSGVNNLSRSQVEELEMSIYQLLKKNKIVSKHDDCQIDHRINLYLKKHPETASPFTEQFIEQYDPEEEEEEEEEENEEVHKVGSLDTKDEFMFDNTSSNPFLGKKVVVKSLKELHYNLYNYTSNHTITKEHNNDTIFSYFFAFALRYYKEERRFCFLKYHLIFTFNYDFDSYQLFLETNMIDYRDLYIEGVDKLVEKWIKTYKKQFTLQIKANRIIKELEKENIIKNDFKEKLFNLIEYEEVIKIESSSLSYWKMFVVFELFAKSNLIKIKGYSKYNTEAQNIKYIYNIISNSFLSRKNKKIKNTNISNSLKEARGTNITFKIKKYNEYYNKTNKILNKRQ